MPGHMSLMLSGALGGIRNIRHDYNLANGNGAAGNAGLKERLEDLQTKSELKMSHKELNFVVQLIHAYYSVVQKTFLQSLAFKSSPNAVTKAEAGGYLWRKLGMLGLVTGAHTFVPKQFMHMVSFSTIAACKLLMTQYYNIPPR